MQEACRSMAIKWDYLTEILCMYHGIYNRLCVFALCGQIKS